jgi:hypothetical protein
MLQKIVSFLKNQVKFKGIEEIYTRKCKSCKNSFYAFESEDTQECNTCLLVNE